METKEDCVDFLSQVEEHVCADYRIIVSFVIDRQNRLLVSDRHAEHVACALGEAVQSAGEICFQIVNHFSLSVDWISNQSTGYCPEPSSWKSVESCMMSLEIAIPNGFRPAYQFRRCTTCDNLNLIKDNWFVCSLCNADLPQEWNCDPST